MPKPFSDDLRSRFAALIREGLSARSAAQRLKLSASTGVRWKQQIRATGSATCAPFGRPKGSGVLEAYSDFFEGLVADSPDITLFELRDSFFDAYGRRVHHSTVAKLLRRLGFTYKKSRWLLASDPLHESNVRDLNGLSTGCPPSQNDLNGSSS